MGIFDEDEVEDIFSDDFEVVEKNPYLRDGEKALKLIAQVIPVSYKSGAEYYIIKQIDELLDREILESLKNIRLHNEARLQLKLSQLSDKLIEEKKYSVLEDKVVIGIGGKFSAGKSKFINSLLKTEAALLPEGQDPTTSIPTFIAHGHSKKIEAYTADNRNVCLNLDAMQALTHKFYQTYSMAFSSFITSIIITEPNMPYKNLVFLDTPGYSKADWQESMAENATDESKAYEQLKNVDFLIWLVDLDNGVISETDLQFIERLRLSTPVLIVGNKADLHTDENIEKITNLISYTAEEAEIDCFGVAAYSSYDGKEWRNKRIIRNFLETAQNYKKSRTDILEQIKNIGEEICEEMDVEIRRKQNECSSLSDVIFRSNNIMEICTLVELYGESMKTLREMKRCSKKCEERIVKLNGLLNRYFGRRGSR